jgi:aspartyl-tRNA(Asn)/glutamyl-tRNA(Gln) amidotransferase subunit B
MTYTIKGKTGDWELVIGLETHIEVLSKSKLFSGASADYNPTIPANTQVSMVDAAMPGMLPVLNEECVNQAIRFGLANNISIPTCPAVIKFHSHQNCPLLLVVAGLKLNLIMAA